MFRKLSFFSVLLITSILVIATERVVEAKHFDSQPVTIDSLYLSIDKIDYNIALMKMNFVMHSENEKEVIITVKSDEALFIKSTSEVSLQKGKNLFSVGVAIQFPRLWWIRDIGGQFLYNALYTIESEADTLIGGRYQFGLRHVDIGNGLDYWVFRFNSHPIYMKGFEWNTDLLVQVPDSKEYYDKMVNALIDMNANMIFITGNRVENKFLYELCDEHGIVIWRELAGVTEDSMKEIISNSRNHPSVALFTGSSDNEQNNEIIEIIEQYQAYTKFLPVNVRSASKYCFTNVSDLISGEVSSDNQEQIEKKFGEASSEETEEYFRILYLNHLLSDELENQKRMLPKCMGTIIDYVPENDHFGAFNVIQSEFVENTISTVIEDDSLKVFVSSDRLEPLRSKIVLEVLSFAGDTLFKTTVTDTILANTSKAYYSKSIDEIEQFENDNVVCYAELYEFTSVIHKNFDTFVNPVDMNLSKAEIKKSVARIDGGFSISLNSKEYALGVCLSLKDGVGIFSNNYFDIAPNKTIVVNCETEMPMNEFLDKLVIKSFVAYSE